MSDTEAQREVNGLRRENERLREENTRRTLAAERDVCSGCMQREQQRDAAWETSRQNGVKYEQTKQAWHREQDRAVRLEFELSRIVTEIEAEREKTREAGGATARDENVINGLVNGLGIALKIVRGTCELCGGAGIVPGTGEPETNTTGELCDCQLRTAAEGPHVPAVTERNGEWATYCIACSTAAGDYTGCRNEPEGWPPPALIGK